MTASQPAKKQLTEGQSKFIVVVIFLILLGTCVKGCDPTPAQDDQTCRNNPGNTAACQRVTDSIVQQIRDHESP